MKKDIILAGVGGQGTFAIASVIGEAAVLAGLNVKQSEVHGMSQRGGDVQSNMRLSDELIASDLIPLGKADLVIAMEPVEALRSCPYMNSGTVVICNSSVFKNVQPYPSEADLSQALETLPNLCLLDAEKIAAGLGSPRANMVILGAVARHLEDILPSGMIRQAIRTRFEKKGTLAVETNFKCFDAGYNAFN